MINLRKLPPELDYLAVMDLLSGYKFPRDKLTKLLNSGDLIRVKKGIYVLGDVWRDVPFSKEILANKIYGPSYVSLDYALSWHRLIPERSAAVTSVTTGRNKQFDTPAGQFTYRYLKPEYYSEGIIRRETGGGRGFLIASPEKALIDKVYFDCGARNLSEMKEYLSDFLRIEEEELKLINWKELRRMAGIYRNPAVRLLALLAQGEQ